VSSRSIALLGIGFGTIAVASIGFLTPDQVESTGSGGTCARERHHAISAYRAEYIGNELEREVAAVERLAAESAQSEELKQAEYFANRLSGIQAGQDSVEPVAFDSVDTLTPEQADSEVRAIIDRIGKSDQAKVASEKVVSGKQAITTGNDDDLALIMILAELV
jgi:hypothetical protein